MKKRIFLVILITTIIWVGLRVLTTLDNQNEGMQFFDTGDLNLYDTDLYDEFTFLIEKLELDQHTNLKDLSLSYDHTGNIRSLYLVLSTNFNGTTMDYEIYYDDGNRYGIKIFEYNTIYYNYNYINSDYILSLFDYFKSIQYGPENGYIYKIGYEGQMSVTDNSNCFTFNTINQSVTQTGQDNSNQTFKLSKKKIISEQEIKSEAYEIYFLE